VQLWVWALQGLAVLGLGGLFIILIKYFAPGAMSTSADVTRAIEVLTGFSLGAESIALFARVGGGIYTKAADVGADLVGKVEAGIPEDDPRNPATIADNVGDNVGDVAGMGADLFGSYVATVLATIVLGHEVTDSTGAALDDGYAGFSPILLPMMIAGVGILFSIIATAFVKISDKAGLHTSVVQRALNMGNWGSIILTAIASYFLVNWLLPAGDLYLSRDIRPTGEELQSIAHFTKFGVMGAIGVGLVGGYFNEYYY
jgi:K(+)-stimulated pyrophosphate-energized sodium pump